MLQKDKIWDEWWFQEFSLGAKLFYLYLITNPSSTIYGIQRHSFKRICYETDMNKEQIKGVMEEVKDKVYISSETDKLIWTYIEGYFYKYSGGFNSNPQLRGFQQWFSSANLPKDLKNKILDDSELKKALKIEYLPNTIELSRKEVVTIRDRFKCVYCNKEFKNENEIELDHLVPKSKGGANSYDNLVASCQTCNLEKLDLSISDVSNYKPDANYRKFEAMKDVKKPDIFSKFRKLFPYKETEKSNDSISNIPTELKNSLHSVIIRVLSDNPNGLEISQIYNIIEQKQLYQNRKGQIPSKQRMSVALGRGKGVERLRVGKGYLYKIKQS